MNIKYIREITVAVCFLLLMTLIALKIDSTEQAEFIGPARVVDGDTVVIDGARLRLSGMDAPELHQICHFGQTEWQCGLAARDQLERLVRGENLVCLAGRRDKYRRPLVICHAGGIEINREMVRTGLAVDYGAYADEAAEARSENMGIWASRFEKPEIWRRQHGDMAGDQNSHALDLLAELWVSIIGFFEGR